MLSIKDAASLCVDTYNKNNQLKIGNKVHVGEDGSEYTVIAIRENKINGFFGVAFQDNNGDIIMSYRGTNEIKDLASIISAGFGVNLPSQYYDADEFYNKIINDPRFSRSEIKLIGHSLGGGLAALIAAKYDKYAELFNSFGVKQLIGNIGKDPDVEYPKITNHNARYDFATPICDQIGNVEQIDVSCFSDFPFWYKPFVNLAMDIIDSYPLMSVQHKLIVELIIGQHGIEELLTAISDDSTFSDQFIAVVTNWVELMSEFLKVPTVGLSNTLQSIFDYFTLATKPVFLGSPIALDLDGDGIERVPLASSTAFFDLDKDGFREKTEWISGDDGFLAVDSNNNGRIDDLGELFGDDIHANGFAKLATYDSNGDGVISASDAVFAQLRIWRDVNGNGLTEEGELTTLGEEGVHSISTSHDQNLQSTFTFANGSTGMSEDVYFEHDQINAVYNGPIELSPDVLVLPWLRGYGTVKDLPVAMSDDRDLLAMVSDISRSTSLSDMFGKVDELIACWAGAASIDPNAMRGAGDFSDRKLTILESFLGQDFYKTIDDVVRNYPRGEEAISSLERAYAILRDHIFTNLVVQTGVGGKFSDAIYDFQEDKITFPVSGQDLVSYFADMVNGSTMEDSIFIGLAVQSVSAYTGIDLEMVSQLVSSDVQHVFSNMGQFYYGTAQGGSLVTDISSLPNIMVGLSGDDTISSGWNDDVIVGGGGNDTISTRVGNDLVFAGDGNDSVNGGLNNDVVYGEAGDDTINGHEDDDLLFGGSGNDFLDGYDGNDTLAGGTGNDRMEGGRGDDTYIYNPGDGHDTIYDFAYSRSGADTIQFGAGIARSATAFSLHGNSLVVTFYGNTDDSITIEDWINSLGRVENFAFSDGTVVDVAGVLAGVAGTEGDDSIRWDESAISFNGLAGNDYIDTGSYDDIIDGGDGDDTIYAGWGDNIVYGGSGNDTISAWSGNDTITGGPGTDRLKGAGGDDTYVFNRGDGQDTILDYAYSGSTNDTLRLGRGIALSDIQFTLDGADLVMTIAEPRLPRSRTRTRTDDRRSAVRDSITIKDWLASHSRIENISFSDGTMLDSAGVMLNLNGTGGNDSIQWWESALHYNGLDGDDTVHGSPCADIIDGGPGNDSIYAYDGDNIVYGGEGNDTIQTCSGIDTLYGNGGDDEIYSGSGNDFVYCGSGGDTVWGGDGNDRLYGQAGADTLIGGGGNDFINGGTGNDRLEGGQGNDTFIFKPGDGQDVVSDYYYGTDTVKFAVGIGLEDIGMLRDSANHLVIGYSDTDTVTVEYFEYAVEKFQLSDGTYLTNTDISQILQDISAYAVQEGIALNSVNDVRENQQLMTLISSAWRSG